jgi:5-methylcytosine-specific restriction endonuclease McrA
MRKVSIKRMASIAEYRAFQTTVFDERGNDCQAALECICAGRGDQLHHIVKRSQGGALMARENVLIVCMYCHDWIERNPTQAKVLGLSRSRDWLEDKLH